MEIIKSENTKTSLWSGGETTELFIYPKNSEYVKRNFEIRISSASVNQSESTFTKLSGFQRKLMILDGSLVITHKNKYEKNLNKFDVDCFSGDWDTSSKGIVTDFNVMTTNSYNSTLSAIELNVDEVLSHKLDTNFFLYFIYIFRGEVLIHSTKNKQIINDGDLIVFNNYADYLEYTIKAKQNSEIIISTINKLNL